MIARTRLAVLAHAAAVAAALGSALALATPPAHAQAVVSTASKPAAAPVALKPGVWETTSSSENTQTSTKRSLVGHSCIPAAEIGNPARIVPPQREAGFQCENKDVKQDGNTISWSIACKSADSTQVGKGRLTLFGDSYAGAAEAELKKTGGKPVKVMQSFSGKWISACS